MRILLVLAYCISIAVAQRSVQTTVVAPWPSTRSSLLCEALVWKPSLLPSLLLSDELPTDDDPLLHWALALRASSPQCELYRGLAKQRGIRNVPALVVGDGVVLVDDELWEIPDWSVMGAAAAAQSEPLILDGEVVHGSNGPIVIVYVELGTQECARIVRILQQQSSVRFVLRPVSALNYEEDPSVAVPTTLGGYGVRLDIRNVEYKVFDDRKGNQTTVQEDRAPEGFVAGVNVSLWKVQNMEALQEEQSQSLPPVWQRRQLPLQAATAIMTSPDPLVTLQDIAQNLPSLARTLVYTKVPEELLSREFSRLAPGRLYVNGWPLALDGPTFNAFELLNVLKDEEAKLQRLVSFVGPEASKAVQRAWIQGSSFFQGKDPTAEETVYRIDVGRGGKDAILYLNDIEKDPQYAQWPRSMQQMLYSMQFGMPPMVRRNVFTILAVVDPFGEKNPGFDLASSLLQSSYPVRSGFLLVDAKDLEECASGSCSSTPVLERKLPKAQLKDIPATAKAVHRLVRWFQDEFSQYAGALLAYVDYLIAGIEDADQGMSLFELLRIHGNLLDGMDLMNPEEAQEEAIDVLGTVDDAYEKSLQFAVEKRLRTGMSFLNGVPLPVSQKDADESLSKTFQKEQQLVFGKVMNGEITDSKPRSIYGMLLRGENVFNQTHPLLSGPVDDNDKYVLVDHEMTEESIVATSPNTPPEEEAMILVEGLFSIDTQEGRALASKFVTAMDSLLPKASASIAYRLVPSVQDTELDQHPLCVLLSRASRLDKHTLLSALSLSSGDAYKDVSSMASQLGISANDFSESGAIPPCIPSLRSGNAITANGRLLPLGASFSEEDIELLISLETAAASAVQRYVCQDSASCTHDVVGRAAAFLALEIDAPKKNRLDPVGSDAIDDPLRFVFNSEGDSIQSVVTVVLDPISDAAQRVSPLLRVMRDTLKLPLTLQLAPAKEIDGESKIPISSYYRFVSPATSGNKQGEPVASFSNLPTDHILTLRMDVPEPWDVQQSRAVQDTDNLRCEEGSCGDAAYSENTLAVAAPYATNVEYELKSLLFFGQCYETGGSRPNGLQLSLYRQTSEAGDTAESVLALDGTIDSISDSGLHSNRPYSDTMVMKTAGYWQLRANPGLWNVTIADGSKGVDMFDIVDGTVRGGRLVVENDSSAGAKTLVMNGFVNKGELLVVKRRPGFEMDSLFYDTPDVATDSDDTIHVFSLATGHLYERFLKIMMLSVTKRTSSRVKFWLFENFLSPLFKESTKAMARRIGCEVEFVTYKWPEWLRGQTEKQRIIWGYKILFLDVLFPLDVKKIIYVDADQVVRGDLKELWDMDLQGAPYGYTPFCTSRESTLGYQFWRDGFWKNHLQGKPYHISALYVVDLDRFRRMLVGDQLRSIYQQLSADPNSLANLDQDLPNYAQYKVPIFSLPQEWLWCESWCSDETKASAKTIDLCNNPEHKEPKVSMAKRIISGPLFNESWVELDAEVEAFEKEYFSVIA